MPVITKSWNSRHFEIIIEQTCDPQNGMFKASSENVLDALPSDGSNENCLEIILYFYFVIADSKHLV